MATNKDTALGIIADIKNAREQGSVTHTMVATVLEYLAEASAGGDVATDISDLKSRLATVETAVDELVDTDQEIGDRLDAAEGQLTALGTPYLTLTAESGTIDEDGNEQPSTDGGTMVLPTEQVRTRLMSLPDGTYSISCGGQSIYLCRYKNGAFVDRVSIESGYCFTVTSRPQVGVQSFDSIRVTYTRSTRNYPPSKASLYGTTASLLTLLSARIEELENILI